MGYQCVYSHGRGDLPLEVASLTSLIPLQKSFEEFQGPRTWFQSHVDHILLLGEGNFDFTKALVSMGMAPRFTSNLTGPPYLRGASVTCYIAINATRMHSDVRVKRAVTTHGVRAFAWNFPHAGHRHEDSVFQEDLLLSTLKSLVLLQRLVPGCPAFTLALTLHGDQFSRWNLLRSVWRTGWRLTAWSDIDHRVFPGYSPSRGNTGEPLLCTNPKFYVLGLPVQQD
jgi:hypothetical protein